MPAVNPSAPHRTTPSTTPARPARGERTPAQSVAFYRDTLGYSEVAAYGAAKQYAKVKELLDAGADVNGVRRGREYFMDTSNVFVAAQGNDPLLMKLFLDAGADANFRSNDGTTPLMYAAIHGSPQLARMLIAAGADLNAKDSHGQTALHIARKGGKSEELVALLERSGAKDLGYTAPKQPFLERAIGKFLHFLRPDFY